MVVIVCKICYIDMAPMEIDLRGASFSGATPLMAFCMAVRISSPRRPLA